MANRRMFSLDVIDTDKFMEMPLTAQALYFHLGMRADDDGFISSPRNIMKLVECKKDDMNVLIARGFVIPFESGIMVIRHWKQHNYIPIDRYKKTQYVEENNRLSLVSNVYMLDTECIQDVSKINTQDRISKDRIDKDKLDKVNNTICPDPKPQPTPSWLSYPLK